MTSDSVAAFANRRIRIKTENNKQNIRKNCKIMGVTFQSQCLFFFLSLLMQARGQDFISEARQLVDATCVDDIENNQICGFYRTSDRTVEEMITICLWDEEREKYRSLCKRRSLAASVGKNYQFASCGCCSGDTFHSNRRLRKDEGDRPFCKYPEPVCGGDPSCPL